MDERHRWWPFILRDGALRLLRMTDWQGASVQLDPERSVGRGASPCPPSLQLRKLNGGHASLCPPYEVANTERRLRVLPAIQQPALALRRMGAQAFLVGVGVSTGDPARTTA
jgi:hypothetical protein